MDPSARRHQLLQAARDRFVEKGYHRTKVADIVGAAGVAQGTFYRYFPDKRSIFAALVDGILERLSAGILRVDVDADIEAQVRYNVRNVVGVFTDDPALAQILLSYSGFDPEFFEKVQAFYTRVRVLLHESLAEGQEMGIVRPGDPELYATFIIGGLKQLLVESTRGDLDQQAQALPEAIYALLSTCFLNIPDAS